VGSPVAALPRSRKGCRTAAWAAHGCSRRALEGDFDPRATIGSAYVNGVEFMFRRLAILCSVLLACGALLAACGDDEGGGEGAGGGAAESTGQTEGAKVIDPKLMEGAKGTVKFCQGKDTTGAVAALRKNFNAKFESQGLRMEFVEFPASADEQRNQFIQRQQAKSGDCDVFGSDVIWTAEFASQKWLYDMTPYLEQRRSEFIPAPLETVNYDGKLWGAPIATDAAFIYYRTDRVDQVPATWQELYSQASEGDGIVFQGAAYEGLTCDWLELAFASGGTVLSEDGTKATINSPENVKATQLMVDVIKNGGAPKAVTTYMEPESLAAFQTGKYTFMRNWPYAYALNQKAENVKGKFKVAPLPEFQGAGKAGVLGGANAVISVYSKNPGGALQLVDYMSGPEHQRVIASEYSLAPTLSATYDDAAVKKALPFAAELKQAVSQAKARPVSPVYPQISQAIYKNVNAALAGQMSPADAMKQAQSDIEKALATF
jgi:multiple sugar transport system substrate-binding protein